MTGVYRPSLVCSLVMRFDEALLNGVTPSPKNSDELAGGSKALLAEISSAIAGAGASGPEVLSKNKDNLSHVFAVIPKQASIELPGFRQAPKFSLTFAYRDFPVDPRAIRAMGVRIYLGVVNHQDFDRGHRLLQKDAGRLASILEPSKANLALAGIVDNHVVTYSRNGSEVKLDGRGLQALFHDTKITSEVLKQLNVNQPINKVVGDLIGFIARGAGIQVECEEEDFPDGQIPMPAAKEIVTRVNKGANAQAQEAGIPQKGEPDSFDFWDIVTNLCYLVGAIPYFDGEVLRIKPARSLYDQKNNIKEGKTPFAGGAKRTVKTADGQLDIGYRKFVYGRNLEEVRFEKKLGGFTVPTILCVSVDTSSKQKGAKRLVTAQWPDAKDGADAEKVAKAKTGKVSPSGKSAENQVLRIPIHGVNDANRLREIARQIYEEVGRGELGGSAQTKDLASLGGDNTDADVLRLRPGDPIEFKVDATGLAGIPPIASELTSQAEQSTAEAVKSLASRFGGREDLAKVLVGTSRGQFKGLQSVFRTSTVKYDWDINSGVGVSFDFQNYIEARFDVTGTTDPRGELENFTLAVDTQATVAGKPPQKVTSKRSST